MRARDTLYDGGTRAAFVYFPITSVISVVTQMRDGSAIEAETVGCEGMCGAQVALGSDLIASRWICQVPGKAYKLDAGFFSERCEQDEVLRLIVGRYVVAVIEVLSQFVACNRLHMVTQRCARWLLATFDRVNSDDFPLTHETLSTMLGVRRAGVSVAAAALQSAGYISYRRGRFTIRDAAGLESAACECYRVARDAYDRLAKQL